MSLFFYWLRGRLLWVLTLGTRGHPWSYRKWKRKVERLHLWIAGIGARRQMRTFADRQPPD